MNSKRIGLLKVALEAAVATEESTDAAPAAEVVAQPAAQETPPVAETVTPEEPAGGNQDEVPAAGTDTAPVTEPEPVVEALAAAASEQPPEDELDEVDLVEIFQDVGDLKVDGIELDNNGDELQQASAAVAELEDLANASEETGAVEKDTEAARTLLEVAVENIYNRLGIENPCIALEDAGGMGATVKEKINSIREQVLRLLRTIMEALKRAFEQAQAYFRRVFDTSAQLEKQAITLLNAVERLKLDKNVDGPLSNQRLKTSISTPKDVTLVQAFDNLSELVRDAVKSANSGYIDYLNTIVDGFVKDQNVERLMNDFPRVLKRSLDERFSHGPYNAAFEVKGASPNVEVLTSNLLPGAHVGVLRLPKTLVSLREFEYSIERIDDPELDDLPILNKEELVWVLNAVIDIAGAVRKADSIARQHGTLVSQLSNLISKMEDKADVNVTPEDREFLKSLSATAPTLARGIHERTFAFAVTAAANALRYADLCARALHDVNRPSSEK